MLSYYYLLYPFRDGILKIISAILVVKKILFDTGSKLRSSSKLDKKHHNHSNNLITDQ